MAGNTYSVGAIVVVTLTVKIGGVLTNATTMALTYKDPTGTDTTVTPSNPSTGTYNYSINANYVGIYQLRWVGTGVASGAQQDYFVVQPINT